MPENPNITKWDKLKIWVGKRHDYFESAYKSTNFSADSAEMGAYRAVFQAMKDLEEQERVANKGTPLNPSERGTR